MSEPHITVLRDHEALAQHVAQWLMSLASQSTGRFSMCLSGGNTPKRLYEILATAPYRTEFPWARTHVFWGDERFVPHDHQDSNFRMVRQALLNHVPVPPAQIYPIPFGKAWKISTVRPRSTRRGRYSM
jgi:6-phosphogluconolactonase